MKNSRFDRWAWLFWYYVFHTVGLIFLPFPAKLPVNEAKKLYAAAVSNDVLIIFNSGGWGDTPLEQADDFMPVLDGIQQVVNCLGYRTTVIPYTRTLRSFLGRMAGAKEQFNSFKHNSQIMVEDIRYLAKCFPEKQFVIAGFSTGGGLTGRTMANLGDVPNVYGITVGVPAWFHSYSSDNSLVLNNSGQDPICAGDSMAIAKAVFKAPGKWLDARLNGSKLSFALAVQIPHHEYPWSSPEVGIPIVSFLESHLKK